MGKLIDADICLEKAWQNFHKQEDEHEKNIDDYDILRDRFYEQSGFECCQQTIVNEQPVEAILKADYENRLKADLVAVLTELQLEVQEMDSGCGWEGYRPTAQVLEVIQQKINDLAVSSGLGKNSKKLEKDFGESDCILRADAIRVASGYCHPSNVAKELAKLPSITPQEPRKGHCKDCKWWKDSDGQYRRGCGAESQCPINTHAVYCGEGYCYMFEPQDSEVDEGI